MIRLNIMQIWHSRLKLVQSCVLGALVMLGLFLTSCSSTTSKPLNCFSIIGVAPMCQPGFRLVDLDSMGNGLYKVVCCEND